MAIDKNPGGRPTVLTPETLAKLKEGFLYGLNDAEACLYCGIGKSTLYNYQQDNPEFMEQKELWKNQVQLTAKLNLKESIVEGDLGTSKWYLERKNKAEFSTDTNLNIGGQADGVPLNLKVNWCDKPSEEA